MGPGSADAPVSLKPGDRVILPGFGGAAIKLADTENTPDADEVLLYRESDILAKLNE